MSNTFFQGGRKIIQGRFAPYASSSYGSEGRIKIFF